MIENDIAALLGACKIQRKIERRPHQRYAEYADQRRGACEACLNQFHPAADAAKHVFLRHVHPVEQKVRCQVSAMAHRVGRPLQHDTVRRRGHGND
jgi:hypothetical protein